MDIKIGNFEAKPAGEEVSRLTMLLWGNAGVGKTTYACSAPGTKLLINFDPDGTVSLGKRDDVIVLDLSGETHLITEKFKTDDPLGLSAVFANEENNITTVIVDSLTSYSQRAVESGISKTKGATIERPSPGAYGARNALTLKMITAMLRVTKKYNKNIIFVSHENAPTTDNDGNVLSITIMLGGQLPNQAALQISEVWFMQDTEKGRRILLRPNRMRTPMKSRMFDTTGKTEFVSKYEQYGKDAPYGLHSLASFIEEYETNGRNKIKVPS